MDGVPNPKATGRTIAQEPGSKTIAQILLTFSNRQLVDAREDDIVPHVVNARTLLAGQAGGVLGSNGFAAANGADVDGMGESVLGVKGPAPRNLAIEPQQQAVITAGSSV